MIHHSHNVQRGSCPTKAFLLGEYTVLTGAPAVVATLEPRFSWTYDRSVPFSFHPESPAGRWAQMESWSVGIAWQDPIHGVGGLGGSTAEFLAVDAHAFPESGPFERWLRYRALFESEAMPPSGADLVAQVLGGVQAIEIHKRTTKELFAPGSGWDALSYFHAAHLPNRKTLTHEELRGLEPSVLQSLSRLLAVSLKEGTQALIRKDAQSLALSFEEFADILWGAGLESQAAHDDRLWLMSLPGIVGVKGTGARLSDGVWVLWSPLLTAQDRDRLTARIEHERGLRLIRQSFLSGSPLLVSKSKEEVLNA